MLIPDTCWLIFFFLIGASVGSFLNVVAYRLPRDLSIVKPASQCTSCHHPLAWYDNLPIIGWFLLRGRCRYCRQPFSIRYALVELFTALLFAALFAAYFIFHLRPSLPPFYQGGYLIYLAHLVLLSCLLASSLIDQEHWIIPLSISYTAVLVGLLLSTIYPYILTLPTENLYRLVPYASPKTAALALGSAIGLAISLLLLRFNIITRSFSEWEQACHEAQQKAQQQSHSPPTSDNHTPHPDTPSTGPFAPHELDIPVNIRREMIRELAFLAFPALFAIICYTLCTASGPLAQPWQHFIRSQNWAAGLLGSLFGFMIGGAVVWATRVFGSLLFGREAMGLGDVHLMAAVGAVLGWISPVLAFFIAPFLGLGFALVRLLWQRLREIWYGPFLSAATLIVMIAHDQIVAAIEGHLLPPAY